jgi:alginate O-acetyltransferase complex protein AlgI
LVERRNVRRRGQFASRIDTEELRLLFSSTEFIFVFLPLAMAGFQLLSRAGRNSVFFWLALVSVCFYAYWNVKMTVFLGASVAGNFLIAQWIARSSQRGKRLWLIAGIVLNLAALAYFKYVFPLLDFLHAHGLSGHDFGNVVLPLGISFFTFTQIGYLVDLEQGEAQSQDFAGYTLFVTFFPHLIAGPIVHHREMMPQFAERRGGGLRSEDVAIGISWFFIGLFKKVIIADTLAPVADAVFAHPQGYGLAAQWTGVLCYSLQLYFDFSGYSDMAIALARIFSIRFPINFNSPYKAANVIDFWQRWHMTLTRYLTLYVYDPIAVAITRRRLRTGKSVSKRAFRTPEGFVSMVVLPIVFTMFVAGVWHGAGFQFLIFGLLHGFYLTVNHAWRIFVPAGSRVRRLLPTPVSVLLTYLAILVPQIFFRSNSAADAGYTLATMAGLHGRGLPLAGNPNTHLAHSVGLIQSPVLLALALAACYVVVWALPNTQEIFGEGSSAARWYSVSLPRIEWQPNLAWALVCSGAFFFVLIFLVASNSFLYFQF